MPFCKLAEGGRIESGDVDSDHDDDAMLDQVAQECMDAIEKKDKEAFMECFHVLVADLLQKLSNPESYEE